MPEPSAAPYAAAQLARSCAAAIHRVFDAWHARFRAITRRARGRFKARDWPGIRRDAVERLALYNEALDEVVAELGGRLDEGLPARAVWVAMKDAYTREILGRDDFELAESFLEGAPIAQMFVKQGLNAAFESSFVESISWETQSQAITFGTEDVSEGIAAFLQKREPDWKGK